MEYSALISASVDTVLHTLRPQLMLGLGVCLLTLLCFRRKPEPAWLIGCSALAVIGSWVLSSGSVYQAVQHGSVLQGSAFAYKLIALTDLAALLTLALCLLGREPKKLPPEFYPLLLCMLLGTHLMVLTSSLLLLFVALELVSVCGYVLTAFSGTKGSAEASVKYLLYGMAASAAMLYGISWLYGFTGTLNLNEPAFAQGLAQQPTFPVALALGLLLAGLLFKVSAVPYHSWAPDVYQTAPLPAVAFFSSGTKAAGIGLIYNVSQALPQPYFGLFVAAAAGATLLLGNLAALQQNSPRRLLAWSSVAQSGFMLAVCSTRQSQTPDTLAFYLIIYVLLTFAAFGLVQVFEENRAETSGTVSKGGNELPVKQGTVKDFAGLGRQNLSYGTALLLVMVGLTGLPPTGGFTAKLLSFTVLLQAAEANGKAGYYLLLLAVLSTLPALYYYLRIPYYLFFKPAPTELRFTFGVQQQAMVWLLTACMLAAFFASNLFL